VGLYSAISLGRGGVAMRRLFGNFAMDAGLDFLLDSSNYYIGKSFVVAF
jgi:hypothetical protein